MFKNRKCQLDKVDDAVALSRDTEITLTYTILQVVRFQREQYKLMLTAFY